MDPPCTPEKFDVELVVVVTAPELESPEAPLRALEDELSDASELEADPVPEAPLSALEDELSDGEKDPDVEAPLNAADDDPLNALAEEEDEIFD